MKVVNMKGTSEDRPTNCKDWLENWESIKGREADKCSRVNCANKATDGSHVRAVVSQVDRTLYFGDKFIVPLCGDCNRIDGSSDEYTVLNINSNDTVPLIKCRNLHSF